ncbi:class I SAM-dependent methyltransferase [Mesonia sp. K7]|uniref:class I SAM-dependent methyltransferase n=1 Tax=Mesonia sp. K7 TaxID=2218606 RepID=UPI000DA826B0|nr:class I SAM-dependent methyltransferase [Mesonia sp. K7]PZD76838.1 class I SAM-dependent methyltransferase [Mesonia sp. K7]
MNLLLIQKEVQNFIKENLNQDLAKVILKGSPFQGVSIQEIAQQINGFHKSKNKLPLWCKTKNIFFPPSLNLEQSSSEATAKYKSELISNSRIADLTGGFGVDSYYFSSKLDNVYYCEINKDLYQIAGYNYQILPPNNGKIHFFNQDGIEFIESSKHHFDWLYLDPARRDDAGKKVINFEQYTPNILKHFDLFFEKADHMLIKTSPLLDLTKGIEALKFFVQEIHVVAVDNEVKELLWILKNKENKNPKITCVNIKEEENDVFYSSQEEEKNTSVDFSEPEQYLYEPNSSILKAGFFKAITEKYQLQKIAEHSHLYTSEKKIDFPGRVFKVLQNLTLDKKSLALLPQKANVSTRNFPLAVVAIKKKYKIKDGGKEYLFFTQNQQKQKIVIHCQKI